MIQPARSSLDNALGKGWADTGRPVFEVLDELEAGGVSTVLVTGIDRDGMMSGPDQGLLGAVGSRWPGKVIASGGVSSLEDLTHLSAAGLDAAIVGRALYQGVFSLEAAIAAAQG